MQLVTGSRVCPTTVNDVVAWTHGYERVALDLGTGDGRYATKLAQQSPGTAVIGIDLCAANMATAARKASANARFLVADACALPTDLAAIADQIVVAFPWGSLLRCILDERSSLISRLVHVMRPGATLEIVINADASTSCNVDLSSAGTRIVASLTTTRGTRPIIKTLESSDLRVWPSSWAKRLAFGRDPHAIAIASCVATESKRSPDAFVQTATLYHPAGASITSGNG